MANLEFTVDATELENKLKLTITTIEQSANLEGLFASAKLPILIGQTGECSDD
jgi:hypothetical protein